MTEWDPEYLAAIERRQCELITEEIARELNRLKTQAWRAKQRNKSGDVNTGRPKPDLSRTPRISYADLQKKVARRRAMDA